jgi:transaldolase
MKKAKTILANQPQAKLLWASVREVFNIIQAVESGCNIVTVQHDILAKAAEMLGKDLAELSLETVRMFARDAKDSGFLL